MSDLKVRGAAHSLSGTLSVPGDKSIGHRAVLFSALADGVSQVSGLSGGEDNLRTISALQALGVRIDSRGPRAVEVHGVGLRGLKPASALIDCGNSGTSIRLLSGLLAPRPFVTQLSGDRYLQARPMRRVAEPLRKMGAKVEGMPGKKAGEIYPPLSVGGPSGVVLHGIDYASKVSSAQVKSAVLLAALLAEGPTRFVEPERSRDHTERMLGAMGAPLRAAEDGRGVVLDPGGWNQRLEPSEREVPGDLSSAAFLLGAAALLPRSRITLTGVGVNPTRTGFLDVLRAMGGLVEVAGVRDAGGEPVADLFGESSALKGVEIAGELTVRAIDELPLLAVLAAYADGPTVIRDAAELRVKESDRIAATCALLDAFGVEVEERPDGMVIAGGGARHAATVDSRGDHRIAMAGVICALGVAGESHILDVDNIATSFPGFTESLVALGAVVQ